MKRAEILAWSSLAGLILLAVVLGIGGGMYQSNVLWAGTVVAIAQGIVVGLAAWGLMLARQSAELDSFIPMDISSQQTGASQGLSAEDRPRSITTQGAVASSTGRVAGKVVGFAVAGPLGYAVGGMIGSRMGGGGENIRETPSAKTLETGFQRLMVGLASAVLIAASVISFYLIYATVSWARANPDKPFPIAGTLLFPQPLDELALLIGLGSAVFYVFLYWMTRVGKSTRVQGEAVNSNFTLGVAGFVALGVAILLGYFNYPYASEVAAGIMGLLTLLQGTELLVNSFRSYSGIEELDQPAIDLDRSPLTPMLSSVWLSSVKVLFAQSVGLSGKKHQRGVIARMMPRVILSVIVIAIVVSCFRVVRPGEVAVLERLGQAAKYTGKDGNEHLVLLQPGFHLCYPWPIDQLVMIPEFQLQYLGVGSQLHSAKPMPGVDFSFWRVRVGAENEEATEYITGDPGSPQLLETYVGILWHVADPEKFYNHLSHSDFYEKGEGGTQALPIYDALIQQAAEFAVTRTFAIHTLDQIMTSDRLEVESHCKQILRDKLAMLDSGIEVSALTIEDVHPPEGLPDQRDENMPSLNDTFLNQFVQVRRGPASAYENVVSMREVKEQLIERAKAYKIGQVNDATGWAKSEISRAQGYRSDKIATAQGEAAHMTSMMGEIDKLPGAERKLMQELARKQTLYTALKDVLAPVNKIIVDPKVDAPLIWQSSPNPQAPRPPGT